MRGVCVRVGVIESELLNKSSLSVRVKDNSLSVTCVIATANNPLRATAIIYAVLPSRMYLGQLRLLSSLGRETNAEPHII